MRPQVRNRDGDVVDPWPFVVVAGTGTLLVLTFGPLYLTALGLSLRPAIAVSLGVSAVVVAVSYRRFVLGYRPDVRAALPAGERIRRLFWVTLVLVALLVLLALPLVGRSL